MKRKILRLAFIFIAGSYPFITAFVGWQAVVAAVIASALSAAAAYLSRPKIPNPPPPAGYKSEEGEQRWNPVTNQYEWIPSEATKRKRAEQEAREAKVRELEEQLNAPDEAREQQLNEFQQAYKQRMLEPLTEQYEKAKRNLISDFTARGMGNSKAMADALSELEGEWLKTQADVENRSIAARESLKQQDFQNKLAVIDSLRRGASISEAERQWAQTYAANQSQAASTLQRANWQDLIGVKMQQWAIGQQAIQSGLKTGSTLAFLYGLYGNRQPASTGYWATSYGLGSLQGSSNPWGAYFDYSGRY